MSGIFDGPEFHGDLTRRARCGLTFVYIVASGGALALVWLVHDVVQANGYHPFPFLMGILLSDLLLALAAGFGLKVLVVWSPQLELWKRLRLHAERQIVPVAVVAALFVAMLIASGIAFATGLLP